jgi:acyl-CoA synthetase (AMP-forming)/AMP-acid ligase II
MPRPAPTCAIHRGIPALHTGDIAHFDERGLFYIDGRISRFVKPYGVRVSLDDIERVLRPRFPTWPSRERRA